MFHNFLLPWLSGLQLSILPHFTVLVNILLTIFQNNKLSFLIEVDGKQHYTGPEATWTHTHSLEEIIYYDKLKNEYCLTHNILLKRIPYFLLGIVNTKTLLEDNKFNVSKEQWRIEKNKEMLGEDDNA